MKKEILLISMVILTNLVFGQNYKGQAEIFFSTFKTGSSINKYVFDNLPTLEECKYVFKENIADTFFARITALNAGVKDMRQQPEEFFEGGLKVATFLTEDIINERGMPPGE